MSSPSVCHVSRSCECRDLVEASKAYLMINLHPDQGDLVPREQPVGPEEPSQRESSVCRESSDSMKILSSRLDASATQRLLSSISPVPSRPKARLKKPVRSSPSRRTGRQARSTRVRSFSSRRVMQERSHAQDLLVWSTPSCCLRQPDPFHGLCASIREVKSAATDTAH